MDSKLLEYWERHVDDIEFPYSVVRVFDDAEMRRWVSYWAGILNLPVEEKWENGEFNVCKLYTDLGLAAIMVDGECYVNARPVTEE